MFRVPTRDGTHDLRDLNQLLNHSSQLGDKNDDLLNLFTDQLIYESRHLIYLLDT